MSIVLVTLIHGFFGKQQYAAIAPNRLTIKLSKLLCLECSTCAIFLSSLLTVSIMARFLRSSLSESGINAPFIFLFNLVISCMPSTNSLSKRFLPMYPYRRQAFHLSIDEFHKGLVFKRFTVIHVARGNHKIQEFSAFFAYQMKFESEEPAMEHLPRCAIPLNVLWIWIL